MGKGEKMSEETELEVRSLWIYLALLFWPWNHRNGFHNYKIKPGR